MFDKNLPPTNLNHLNIKTYRFKFDTVKCIFYEDSKILLIQMASTFFAIFIKKCITQEKSMRSIVVITEFCCRNVISISNF